VSDIRLGVDIGGTGIKGAPVDVVRGQLTAARTRIDTPAMSTPDNVLDIVKRIASSHEWHGPVGITFPGVVLHGVVRTTANMDKEWQGFDADSFFTESLGMAVTVMNDADAAGVAEMRFGAGVGHRGVVVMVTLGTGIGTALFMDGVLVPNTEFGHMEVNGKDAERQASGRAREREKLTWREYSKRIEEYLRRLDALLWPDLIIVGGGVSKESAKWLGYIKVRAPIAIAVHQNLAGIIGAAALAGTTR
jgi:polyphosphate glucokinase